MSFFIEEIMQMLDQNSLISFLEIQNPQASLVPRLTNHIIPGSKRFSFGISLPITTEAVPNYSIQLSNYSRWYIQRA
jgi:hypothetical protein